MSEVAEAPRLRQLCHTVAKERGLDPIGGAYPYDYFLMVEAPLPWTEDKFNQPGVLPQAIHNLMNQVLYISYPDQWMRVCLCIIAPDKDYSEAGMRRVIYAKRPEDAFAEFSRQEYLVPEEEMGALAWALFAHSEQLPSFDRWLQPDNVRDFFVCTDGVIDRACAVAGMKLYSTLRKLPEAQPGGSVRIWKTSHFGGHVYAATLFTLNDGRMWGFLDGDTGVSLLRRPGDIESLRGCYRGWFGAESSFINVVERELMMQHGWAWFDFLQQGAVIAEDPDAPVDKYDNRKPRWGQVELTYHSPDGALHGRATARVEVSHHIETFYASDNPETHSYEQYRVMDLSLTGLPQ